MKAQKRMTEIRQEKWRRQRLILEKLDEKPMTLTEIEQLVYKGHVNKIGRRTIQNYLAELKALELIEYDDEARIYQLTHRKKVFHSKHEYDIAMKHSRNLTLSTSEKQRFDQTNPFLALDLLAFHEISSEPDIDDKCFVQHLKTGYFKEVYTSLQKYRKLMDEAGYSTRPSFPKLTSSFGDIFSSQSPQEMVTHTSTMRNFGTRESYVKDEIEPEQDFWTQVMKEKGIPTSYKMDKKTRELHDLRALLVGKIYSIVNDVVNGIPLNGYCEHCPHQKITIKGRS